MSDNAKRADDEASSSPTSSTSIADDVVIKCSICDTTDVTLFSKRQQKRATFESSSPEHAVKCKNCIAAQQQDVDTKEETEEDKENNKASEETAQETKNMSKEKVDKDEEVANDNDEEDDDEEEEAEFDMDDNDDEDDDFQDSRATINNDDDDDVIDPCTPSLNRIPRKKIPKSQESQATSSTFASPNPDISLADLKRQIMGRDLIQDRGGDNDSMHDDDDEEHILNQAVAVSDTKSSSLRHELTCAICRDLCYPPVSAPCGHSYCQECMEWWKSSQLQGSSIHILRCPTCRSAWPRGMSQFNVNIALKACVVALFGDQVIAKIRSKKATTKGEREGAHDRGYEVLSPLYDEYWRFIGESGLRVKRNIVLDATDQRMQLALTLTDSIDYGSNSLSVNLALLQMEEDEAIDCGFPTFVTSAEDEHMICSSESRFQYTHLQVLLKSRPDDAFHSVARLTWNTSRSVPFVLDDSIANHHEATALKFLHEDTGTEMELDLTKIKNNTGGTSTTGGGALQQEPHQQKRRPELNRESFVYDAMDEEEEQYEEEDDNEFENDGFVVGDGDESEMEGQFSGEEDGDDDAWCTICRDGGELMICDGGDVLDGCGKSFHAACVHRSKIPDGDWVCQECATSSGIEASEKGHEFPVADNDKNAKPESSHRDESSGDEEFQTTTSTKKRTIENDDGSVSEEEPTRATKRQRSIDDDSDEEENKELEVGKKQTASLHDSSDEEEMPAKKTKSNTTTTSLNDSSDDESSANDNKKPAAGSDSNSEKPATSKRRMVIDDSDSD